MYFQTPACDLKSLLPLALKRKILQELEKGCPSYQDRPEKQKEVYSKYKQYLVAVSQFECMIYTNVELWPCMATKNLVCTDPSQLFFFSLHLKKSNGMDIPFQKLAGNLKPQ